MAVEITKMAIDDRVREVRDLLNAVLQNVSPELELSKSGNLEALPSYERHALTSVLTELDNFHRSLFHQLILGAQNGSFLLVGWLANSAHRATLELQKAIDSLDESQLEPIRTLAARRNDWPVLLSDPQDPQWQQWAQEMFSKIGLGSHSPGFPKRKAGKRTVSVTTPFNRWLSETHRFVAMLLSLADSFESQANLVAQARTNGTPIPEQWKEQAQDRATMEWNLAKTYANGQFEIFLNVLRHRSEFKDGPTTEAWLEKVFIPLAKIEFSEPETHPVAAGMWNSAKREAEARSSKAALEFADIEPYYRRALKKNIKDSLDRLVFAATP